MENGELRIKRSRHVDRSTMCVVETSHEEHTDDTDLTDVHRFYYGSDTGLGVFSRILLYTPSCRQSVASVQISRGGQVLSSWDVSTTASPPVDMTAANAQLHSVLCEKTSRSLRLIRNNRILKKNYIKSYLIIIKGLPLQFNFKIIYNNETQPHRAHRYCS